jgi:hypothetical protein
MFHYYNLNRYVRKYLDNFEVSERAIVLRWRPDFIAENITAFHEVINGCIHYLRHIDMGVICTFGTSRLTQVTSNAKCHKNIESTNGLNFLQVSCCHREHRGIVWDGFWMTTKFVVDSLDGSRNRDAVISYEFGRSESRVCNTFVMEANLTIIYPKNRVGEVICGPEIGYKKVTCGTSEG